MNFSSYLNKIVLLVLSVMLAACSVKPNYSVPVQPTGMNYKAVQQGKWVQANPQDDLSKGDWWQRYQDPELNRLMILLNQNNQTISQAYANYQAALAKSRQARAGFFPTLGSNAGVTRSGGNVQSAGKTFSLGGDLSWEIDLWGKVRSQVDKSNLSMQAAAAELANTRLSMQGQLAENYFSLRVLDLKNRQLQQIVKSYERSVRDNQNLYNQGVAAKADVVSAQVQLENARVQAIGVESDRQALVSAIAVLVGQPSPNFNIQSADCRMHLPSVPVGIPSTLLQRRPDIAAAERRVMAANAEIGVSRAAWFPNLIFSGTGALQSSRFADWVSSPLRVWSLGPALALSIFDGGARAANLDYAKANYNAEVASYRQIVLNALKEVDDALLAWDVLERQQKAQIAALGASRTSLEISRNQYMSGLIDYLSLVQVENTSFNAEIETLEMQRQQLIASVKLILALGGGWSR